jgi:hypothetical protein
VYAAVHEPYPDARMVAPPRADAVLSERPATAPAARDQHIQAIANQGRLGWQKQNGYNRRALVEGQMGRFKQVIGRCCAFTLLRLKPPRSLLPSRFSTECSTPELRPRRIERIDLRWNYGEERVRPSV